MKVCPLCNRNYADETLTFCLEDGSVLSAPNDPNKTLQIPGAPDTDSILTRVSYQNAKSSDSTEPPMPTMLATQKPAAYSEKPQFQTERANHKLWLAVGILGCLVALLAAALVFVNRSNAPTANNGSTSNQNGGQTNSDNSSRRDKKTENGFGPINDHASLEGENLTYYPGTTPEQCQADCAKNERCKGFTFIRAGAYNPQDSAMCYLASFVKNSVPHACCISGVKR